jgi:hypothetical protein
VIPRRNDIARILALHFYVFVPRFPAPGKPDPRVAEIARKSILHLHLGEPTRAAQVKREKITHLSFPAPTLKSASRECRISGSSREIYSSDPSRRGWRASSRLSKYLPNTQPVGRTNA